MKTTEGTSTPPQACTLQPGKRRSITQLTAVCLATQVLMGIARAGENVPHAPFAQWAEVLEPGQFVGGVFAGESEAYHIWAGSTYHNVTVKSVGESYGIDTSQGYFTLQYGIATNWTADLAIGGATVGWRYFANGSPSGTVQSTTGIMDVALGVRYQILKEDRAESPWRPTLTLRAGGVLPGSYDKEFPFAPGTRSAAIEGELLLRKHCGWTGLGIYGDALLRWNKTTHNDQYIASAGLFQQIQHWELQAGFRHLGTFTGEDIILYPDQTIYYPRSLRENNDSLEFGVNYTTPKKHIQIGIYGQDVLAGSNTDGRFWLGAYLNVPLGHTKPIDFSRF